MSILDEIIASHSGAPVVVHEEHDLNKINWVRGLSDPGEMISCGYLPEARRLANEDDNAYVNRIQGIIDALPENERLKIISTGTQSAIRRANYATSRDGKVMFFSAGPNSWARLGVNVSEATTWEHAARLSRLTELVIEKVAAINPATGKPSGETFLIIRKDTGAELGRAGTGYKTVQVTDMFTCLDHVAGEFGARYVSAGAVDGGKKFFATMTIPGLTFKVKGDKGETMPYITFMGDNMGTGACPVVPGTYRAECANTLAQLIREFRKHSLRIRHSGNIQEKMRDTREALGLQVTGFSEFRASAERLAETPIDFVPYANGVLDDMLGAKEEKQKLVDELLAAHKEEEAKKIEKELKRRGEIFADILERYETESGRSAWHAVNAFTGHTSHNTIGRQVGSPEDRQARRMESVLMGAGDEMNQVALAHALAV